MRTRKQPSSIVFNRNNSTYQAEMSQTAKKNKQEHINRHNTITIVKT